MAKTAKREYTCPVCGQTHTYEVVLSYYCKDMYLDGYKNAPEFLDLMMECPGCHHVASDIRKDIPEDEKKEILSEEFQKAFESLEDTRLRAFVMNAKLREERREYRDAAKFYQLAYWYGTFQIKENSREYLFRYIDDMIKALENHDKAAVFADVVALIDSFRQAERYEEALSLIADFHRDIDPKLPEDNVLKKIVSKEEELIRDQVSRPVLLREV